MAADSRVVAKQRSQVACSCRLLPNDRWRFESAGQLVLISLSRSR